MSSSVHVNNKGKDILILGEETTQGLDDTILAAEAKYPINFTQSGKRFIFSLHDIGSNSFLFANPAKVYQFLAKNWEIKICTLCLDNVSKGFTINDIYIYIYITGLKGVVKYFLLILILLVPTIIKISINI